VKRLASGLLVGALCLAVAACAGIGIGQPPTGPAAESPAGKTAKAKRSPKATPDAAATATPAPRAPKPTPFPDDIPGMSSLVGRDGRLTVLLLGSDYRKGVIGERIDAILVATINPRTGKMAMVSLPRDTVGVPIGDGRVYTGRINALFWELERQTGKRDVALARFTDALAYAFDTEIDYYVLARFRGFERLVDSMGGVQVELAKPFVDPSMRVTPKGLRLKAGKRRLDGKHALAFARSRHTDSDYERSRRQQQLIASAVSRLRELGIGSLPGLVKVASRTLETNIPLDAAPAMLALAQRADSTRFRSVVLAPSTFASPGSVLYTIRMKVEPVRRLFDRAFGPVK
jgi:polyisoprenyl-teichoic acid--peptidoglycan teichoic acid transferase